MKKQSTKSQANQQVIITGVDITPEQVLSVNEYLRVSDFPTKGFCHNTGGIGYIDSSARAINALDLATELQELARRFPYIELGVTLMSGPPGSYNCPVVSYLVRAGIVKQNPMPHLGHKPPQRNKGE